MRYQAIPILGAAAALACAGAPPARPVVMPTPGEAAGEVVFVPSGSPGFGAAFDERRVMGPAVNMTMTPEGVWGGDVRGRNVLLEISEGRLSGAAFDLTVEQEGDVLHLAGIVDGRRVNVRLSPRQLQGTVNGGVCSFDLALAAPGSYRGFLSCPARPTPATRLGVPVRGVPLPSIDPAEFHLSGDAVRFDQPVMPQLALALLAVLPP